MNPLNRKSSVSRLVNNLSLIGDDVVKNPNNIGSSIGNDMSTTPVMKKAYDY